MKQSQMVEMKRSYSRAIKNQKQQNYELIRLREQRSFNQKLEKRNRVRHMEQESKENLASFWDQRLEQFQSRKNQRMDRTLKNKEKCLGKISKLEQKEGRLIEELIKVDEYDIKFQKSYAKRKSID